MRDLRGMVVVITGASAGIGAALARSLHRCDAKLVLAARRKERLDSLNAELGNEHHVVQADVAREQDCRNIIDETIARFGRIDTLVANAGYGIYETVDQTSPAQFRDIFAANVFGTTDLIHAAIPEMLKQHAEDGYRGQVMIVSSVAARRGVPYLGAYSATKAAQLSIAEAMRVELADNKIAVTSVHPIMTKTEFGTTAESRGRIVLPRSDRDLMTQSVEHVARRMVEGIARPRAEVWPSAVSRILVGLGTLIPMTVDRMMAGYYQRVVDSNRASKDG
ncbi:MAG: SDR family NAD(P)-dependent oxidoreductase [Burkholderiales bacterium]|nr:SDR family NAD(P)-dependent oxidoreductase [Phycisphaerae bacterium]